MPTRGWDACNGSQYPWQGAMPVKGCDARARVRCPQWDVMPMPGGDAHPPEVQPCCCQDTVPQVPRGTVLLPRTHEGSSLPLCSPNAAFHGVFFAAKPFPSHPATAARTQPGFWHGQGHTCPPPACSANPQGIPLCSGRALPPGRPLRCHHHPTLPTGVKHVPMPAECRAGQACCWQGAAPALELQTKLHSANSRVIFIPSYPERFKHQSCKNIVGEPTTSRKERLLMGFIPKQVV